MIIIIKQSTFTHNSLGSTASLDGGGALYIYAYGPESVTTIQDSTFRDNLAGSNGGAMRVGYGNINIFNTMIQGNKAPNGDGINCRGSTNLRLDSTTYNSMDDSSNESSCRLIID